jgi:hypothetical protein
LKRLKLQWEEKNTASKKKKSFGKVLAGSLSCISEKIDFRGTEMRRSGPDELNLHRNSIFHSRDIHSRTPNAPKCVLSVRVPLEEEERKKKKKKKKKHKCTHTL